MSSYNPKNTVYVSGLDQQVDKSILKAAFIPFGDLVQIQLPLDANDLKKHRGFAFVEFESSADAQAAMDNLNLSVIDVFVSSQRNSLARPSKCPFPDPPN